jgi:hypothetical protein
MTIHHVAGAVSCLLSQYAYADLSIDNEPYKGVAL